MMNRICTIARNKDAIFGADPVGKPMFGTHSVDQCSCLRAIRHGAVCNNDAERRTMRIHGQMSLAVEAPFVRAIASLPPLAPVACGRTLIWLASILDHWKCSAVINCSSKPSHAALSRPGRSGGGCSTSLHSQVAYLATAHRYDSSRARH